MLRPTLQRSARPSSWIGGGKTKGKSERSGRQTERKGRKKQRRGRKKESRRMDKKAGREG